MKAIGLTGVSRGSAALPRICGDRVRHPAAGLVGRNLHADQLDVLWAAGITYLSARGGFL